MAELRKGRVGAKESKQGKRQLETKEKGKRKTAKKARTENTAGSDAMQFDVKQEPKEESDLQLPPQLKGIIKNEIKEEVTQSPVLTLKSIKDDAAVSESKAKLPRELTEVSVPTLRVPLHVLLRLTAL